jgi:hypothetical protein
MSDESIQLPSIPQKENNMSKKIEKFEDFIAWQKPRQLTRKIYQATTLPGFLPRLRIKRPGTSLGNIHYVEYCGGVRTREAS